VASIDYGVFVYQGTFAVPQAAALSRAQYAGELRWQNPQQALVLAREAASLDPGDLFAETALGEAAAATGHTQEARTAIRVRDRGCKPPLARRAERLSA
jgi:Flp pilus assembly protein TadD